MKRRNGEEQRRQSRSGPGPLTPHRKEVWGRPGRPGNPGRLGQPGRPGRLGRLGRPGRRLVVLVGAAVLGPAAVIGLAACSGTSTSPHVADLGTSSGNNRGGNVSVASTVPAANPTLLLDEWASCMRSHGDPDQADPTITADKLIDITWNPAVPGGIYGTNKGGQGDAGPGQYCRAYLTAAQTALRGGQSEKQPDAAQLERFSSCMRANGVPDFPDSSPGGGLSISLSAGGDLNPNSPAFRNAAKLCAQKTGVQGFVSAGSPPPGTIELNGALPGSGAGG